MLEKLAKQTAVYGISTIAVRFLNYLLTPYFTRVFGQETYGVMVDVYALIPFALVLLSMGMESGYFRFATRAEQAGGEVAARGNGGFSATTWGLHLAGCAALFRGCRAAAPSDRTRDGSGLYGPCRLRRLGRAHHPVRRAGYHPLFAPPRTGPGP